MLLAVACTISSCKGDDSLDPANTFVGAYSYEDSYQLSWGPSSGSYTDNGAFAINKVSHNKVDFSNPWKTTATVTGNQFCKRKQQ